MAAQIEIEGTESPNRNPELHALGLELYGLQQERMDLTKEEKAKRDEIAGALKALGIDHYHCDGIELWLEPGPSKIKVRKDSDGGGSEAGEDPAE